MSVEINPDELTFQRPFTVDEVSQILRIHNPNTHPVAFKVKTTAPKQYCVRPNSGRIEPGHDVEVTVALQIMKTEPPADAKCRDKFLVQSVKITSDKEFANVTTILDTADKHLVQEKKIRVTWLPPDGEGVPGPTMTTPSRQPLANGNDNTPEPNRTFLSPGDEPAQGSTAPPPYTLAIDTSPEAAEEPKPDRRASVSGSPLPNPVTKASIDELQRQLESSEERLRLYVAREGAGLRQRGGAERKMPPTSMAKPGSQQGTDAGAGVPVQAVAVLCLLSFLLAYFFF